MPKKSLRRSIMYCSANTIHSSLFIRRHCLSDTVHPIDGFSCSKSGLWSPNKIHVPGVQLFIKGRKRGCVESVLKHKEKVSPWRFGRWIPSFISRALGQSYGSAIHRTFSLISLEVSSSITFSLYFVVSVARCIKFKTRLSSLYSVFGLLLRIYSGDCLLEFISAWKFKFLSSLSYVMLAALKICAQFWYLRMFLLVGNLL